MSAEHRNNDSRKCGAVTQVIGQTNVYINSSLAAVEGDPNSHGDGQLVSSSAGTVFINGKKVIVISDTAKGDDASHPPGLTDPAIGSPNVNIY